MLDSIDRKIHPLCVLDASAGSGKTFQLVLEYLSILLSPKNAQKYKGIVAITFTNKASTEMKTRIIDALFGIAKYNSGKEDPKTVSIIDALNKILNLKEAEIRKRASHALKAILHGYENFNVSTIDKFNLRLIKSFSNDLNLPAEFEISLNENEVLDEVLELLLSNIGSGDHKELTKLVKSYAKSNFKDGGKWNFKRHLLSFASSLNNEKNKTYIELLHTFSFDENEYKLLTKELQDVDKEFVRLNTGLTSYFKESNIDEEKLHGKSNTMKTLNRIMNYEKFPSLPRGASLLTSTFLKYCNEPGDSKGFTGELKMRLLELNHFQADNAQRQMALSRYKSNFFNMALLKYVSEALKELRLQTKVIRISEFNELIGTLVQKEDAPYIYERFGTRYEHFLLDEFQDTSRLQWLNLLPLLKESLSYGKQNLIVGDPKQSIYRFNNGLAEQFVSLPAIYNPENDPKIEEHSTYFNKMGIKKPLEMNYRSAPEIVNFNNDFFAQFCKQLPPSFERFYDAVGQDPSSSESGFVKILSEKSKMDVMQMIDEVEAIIKQSLADDFDPGDICILTDKNKLGVKIANELTKRGTTVFSQESLLISRNMEVRLLLSFLKWRMRPTLDLMKRQFAELYFRMYPENEDPYFEYIIDLKTNTGRSIKVFDDARFLKEYFGGAGMFFKPFENLVQLVQDFIRLMKWKETTNPYLHQFSDLIFQFQSTRQSDLSKFIEYFEENKMKFALKMPESKDAVQIMTIHKSKGLEFPIVIIPKIDFSLSIHREAKFFVEADGKVLYTTLSKNNVLDEIYNKSIEEEALILLDKLNLLYVGLTRPERRLYIFNRFEKKTNLGKLFHENLIQSFDIEEQDGVVNYQNGQPVSKFTNKIRSEDEGAVFYTPQEVATDGSKLNIAYKGIEKEFFEDQSDRLFGIYFHLLMAETKDSEGIKKSLSKLVDSGKIESKMSHAIEDAAVAFYRSASNKGIFDDLEKVIDEHPILLPSGKMLRPDKVIVRDQDVIVLDFKTGKKDPEHEVQVWNYKKNLEAIFNKKVVPMLYYTQTDLFIQV